MRLKSLELVGFKSFSEATTISFATGMTAVVGPNGCGKSNVVDAIRWVLGEQAPTRLRGKSAEDLIYAGNDSNSAAGMAEVTLVLEAEEGSSLPEPYSTLSEVAVTRRVYRSSDSEYLLNKIPCRLKDITEFFMAAQIYSRGYALIEQGRIEEIIQAKPHEVRSLVEEAAGLSLFKGRREISERKLERVKENLARLDDVLSEIERQLNFARRQAKKAEAFKIIKAELSELERLAAARRLLEQREELAKQNIRDSELKASAESARDKSSAAQTEVEAASSAAQAARSELGGSERELENLHIGAEERARTRGFLERRLTSINDLEPTLIARLAELETKATLARATRADAGARHARECAGTGGDSEAALKEIQARNDAAQRELKDAERRAEELKDDLSETIREAAVLRGRLGDFAGERAELEERLRSGGIDAPARTADIEQAQAALRAGEERLEAVHLEIAALEGNSRESAEHEIKARAALEHLAAQVSALRLKLSARRPLGASTVDGAGERLRTVLESLNGDRPARDPAMFREVVRAPEALRPALRAVLGEELDAVVVDSPMFAIRAIEILKENKAGRLSFFQESDAAAAAYPAIEAPGIAGRLVDMLEVEARFAPVAEAMLGHVMVADSLRAALEASNLNGHGAMFVTREGDVVWPGRLIRGGSAEEDSSSAGAAQEDASAAQAQTEELALGEDEHRAAIVRLGDFRASRARVEADLDAARRRAKDAEHTAGELRATLARAEQAQSLAEAHLGAALRRVAEIGETVAVSNARMEELAHDEREARERLAALREDVAARRAAAEELSAAMVEAAAHFEACKSQLAALERELAHAVESARDLEAQIDEHRSNLERSRVERADFERELEKLGAQDQAARARESELADSIATLSARCERCERELEEKRAELKLAHEVLAALEAEVNECALRRERARTLSEELARGFLEKFLAEFDAVAAELVSTLHGRDAARDEQRLTELRAKAERIGEVNLAAESEVHELEERANTLGSERADLKRAVDDLSQTITRLNREARKRFAETFEGAARNFAELFPKLLRGGKGRLELTEATDVLEAGVNILIQPAGKKVKEIALLSGGEKALSAMALVFSLFLLNPSPFCVMDEVDAPLDEFSLAAFTSLLAELKQRSQFIVITHNQRTMQRADQIHGVTMDRPGISRVISLRIPAAA
ncbi:MAG TPA: chromosome segregation protein SMC [Candidatus Binataceae bacterium]